MTNYIDHRLSARASRQFRRVAMGRTNVVQLMSGAENRNAAWKFKKMKFSANYALLDYEAQQEVTAAFMAANAMLYLFRYRDYGDYRVESSPLVGVQIGTKEPVQLTKRYSFGSVNVDRELQAVVKATVTDMIGTPVAGTLNTVLGKFTPDNDWGIGPYKWSGVFDLWVRFASDEFDMTMLTLDIATTDVELVEQRAVT